MEYIAFVCYGKHIAQRQTEIKTDEIYECSIRSIHCINENKTKQKNAAQ